MAKITIRNQKDLQLQIKKAITRKVARIFVNGKDFISAQAEKLKLQFANSQEFKEIKTSMVGEFGFTPQEVSQLDRILDLLVPGGNDITTGLVKLGPGKFLMELNWVDFAKLKEHEFAQHDITKLDESGAPTGPTNTVSWVQWLEEGETFRGFQFVKAGGVFEGQSVEDRSRSGEGLMRKSSSGAFVIEPTRIFEIIAKSVNGDFAKKQFKELVKKSKKIFGG